MIHSKKAVTLCTWLIVLNLAFIWGNSLLPRELSSALSKMIGSFLSHFTPESVNPAEGEGQGILRKIAHFTEFCTLGMLLSWLVRMVGRKKWEYCLIPLIAGAFAAFLDETIQIFVPGRGPQLRDVGIDILGVMLGILLLSGIALCKHKRKT